MLFDTSGADIEILNDELFIKKKIRVSVLRLDKIHPVVSGNKLFKLHYFLAEAAASSHKTILTFGGAWSNHLAATAFACRSAGLKSIGMVRGEEPAILSPSLKQCIEQGMQLKFIARESYAGKEHDHFTRSLKKEYGECHIIPEGGYHPTGAKGASLIMKLAADHHYSHLVTALGTATTLGGLLMASHPKQAIIGIPVLKNMTDIRQRLQYLTGVASIENLQLLDDYHFGGYAKKTESLIEFMNDCWVKYQLPLDFVYTAKMMFAIIDSIKNDRFPEGSDILCLHTGGLQGNRSLPLNSLLF